MKEVNNKNKLKEDDILETFLKLPKKNLEARIKQLEDEIKTRQALSNEALSGLGTHQLQIKDKLWRLRYTSMLNEGFIVNRDFIKQLINLEEQRFKEMINCFNDILHLKEKLQEAREELELDRQKLKLIELDYDKKS